MTDLLPAENQLTQVTLTRREKEQWVPVWWNRLVWGHHQRIKAIAGNPSRTGKTVRIRAYLPGPGGGRVERSVSPKNLEPR